MSGHSSQQVILRGATQTLVGTATKTVISNVFHISDLDRRAMVVDITPGSSISGTATGILQTSHDGTTWTDSKTVALSGTSVGTIKLLDTDSGDATYLPLRPLGRVVVTTSGAAGSVSGIFVTACK